MKVRKGTFPTTFVYHWVVKKVGAERNPLSFLPCEDYHWTQEQTWSVEQSRAAMQTGFLCHICFSHLSHVDGLWPSGVSRRWDVWKCPYGHRVCGVWFPSALLCWGKAGRTCDPHAHTQAGLVMLMAGHLNPRGCIFLKGFLLQHSFPILTDEFTWPFLLSILFKVADNTDDWYRQKVSVLGVCPRPVLSQGNFS